MEHRRVWIESWQMECCGDPFKVGAEVEWATWPVVDREWFAAVLGDTESARLTDVEEHHDEVNPPALQLVGVVRSIDAVFCQFAATRPGGRVLYPVENSGSMFPRSSAAGFEMAPDGSRLVGYAVDLEVMGSKTNT